MNDKDLMKKLSAMTNDEIEQEAKRLIDDGIPKELIKPLFKDEMLIEHIKNSVERKKRLMHMDKEKLVDMVFDLESRNETLIHNLSEVEKMYNKLKSGVDELETEVFSLRNQNKLWQCIVEDYKKKEKEEEE